MEKVYNINIAIVPNHAEQRDTYITLNHEKIENFIGRKLDEKEQLVQVWLYSEDQKYKDLTWETETNLTDHGWESVDKYAPLKQILGYSHAPGLLPASMFEGLKEGDKIVLINHPEITLTLCQRENRYASYGEFEQVFERVTARR